MGRMPQVTAQDLIRFLKSHGFKEDRQSGSHLTLRHEARNVSVTIPIHTGCDVGRGLAVRILKDAGFSIEDYYNAAGTSTLHASPKTLHSDLVNSLIRWPSSGRINFSMARRTAFSDPGMSS